MSPNRAPFQPKATLRRDPWLSLSSEPRLDSLPRLQHPHGLGLVGQGLLQLHLRNPWQLTHTDFVLRKTTEKKKKKCPTGLATLRMRKTRGLSDRVPHFVDSNIFWRRLKRPLRIPCLKGFPGIPQKVALKRKCSQQPRCLVEHMRIPLIHDWSYTVDFKPN